MKILQLCKKFPYPLNSGEAIAVGYLSKALRDLGCEITLLSMNTTRHPVDVDGLPEDFDHYREIHSVRVDNRIKPLAAFANLFSKDSYHVERFISEDFKVQLVNLLRNNRFDIIQMETLFLAPYLDIIRSYSNALVVMRAHNIEHEIWDRISDHTRFFPRRWYLNYLSKKLKRYELEVLNEYDFLVPISDADLTKFRTLGYKNGALTIPIGLKVNDYARIPARPAEGLSLAFIGSMDWMPNAQGIEWFLSTIWPAVHAKYPTLKLHIAGRHMPSSMQRFASDQVILEGDVADARTFMASHSAMIVPLLSGSGMRVKILEGMALGRTIITTSLGLEGIPARHKKEVLIANTQRDFIEAIDYLVDHPQDMERLRESAVDFIQNNFDHKALAEHLLDSYRSYMEEHKMLTY